jgi:Tol biopolymer transport system component
MNPEYVKGGFLAYQQRNDTGTLVVRPVDPSTGEFIGQPKDALVSEATRWGNFSVTADGDLLYMTSGQLTTSVTPQPFLLDLERQVAERLPTVVSSGSMIRWPAFSPDGARMAMSVRNSEGTDDLVLYDFDERTNTQITFGSDTYGPRWSADGDWIYYSIETGDSVHVFRQHPVANSIPERVQADGWMGDISPDGRFLAFIRPLSNGGDVLMLLDMQDGSIAKVDSSSAVLDEPRFSPDGSYIAYSDNAAGPPNVRLAAVDGLRVSSIPDVMGYPRWSKDGHSLFIAGRDAVQIPVRTSPSFTILGAVKAIYNATPPVFGSTFSPDGTHAVVIAQEISFAPVGAASQSGHRVIWLQNWSAYLKREFAK